MAVAVRGYDPAVRAPVRCVASPAAIGDQLAKLLPRGTVRRRHRAVTVSEDGDRLVLG
ncbi:hypothetical protein GS485_08000 [Rhodococcus hoagii]|nr:hypothetical protein [Prescottella equi]